MSYMMALLNKYLCYRRHGFNLRQNLFNLQKTILTISNSRQDILGFRSMCIFSQPRQRKENVILMGGPGSGKTTVGRILSSKLGMPVLDIDNDHLENQWKMPVAQKLMEVGGERFVQEEGLATLGFQAEGHVVSLTGSNPMHAEAMNHLRKTGPVVFLDVQHSDIIFRLERMKVNRIVGQTEGVSMMDILKYRQQYYEKNYDLRVICEEGETAEDIADKAAQAYTRFQNVTKYTSTRGSTENCDLLQAVLKGQPDDGGLFVPTNPTPNLSLKQWQRLVELSYRERAIRILEHFIHPKSISPQTLQSMINASYTEEIFGKKCIFPIRRLGGNQYVQELFHGPTASFKDSALQLMPKIFHHAMTHTNSNNRYLILVATSGDTGGAVLDGFSKLPGDSGVSVMVLFPEKGISPIQKDQMTSAQGKNIHVLGVNADFDYCQTVIKRVFADRELKNDISQRTGYLLSAANSINWGRLVPQIVHHASAYLDLVKNGILTMGERADLCVPTGNFGNILAAYYCQLMGIPWRRLICASNVNNVLTDFIQNGKYDLTSRNLHLTTSPAIDILKSSNVERLLYHITGGDYKLVRKWYEDLNTSKCFSVGDQIHKKMKDLLLADWCSEADCTSTISQMSRNEGYMLDPHTAIAKTVGDRHRDAAVPMVLSSTAHYAKFAGDVLRAVNGTNETILSNEEMFSRLGKIGTTPKMHGMLEKSVANPKRIHNRVVDADYKVIMCEMEQFIRRQS